MFSLAIGNPLEGKMAGDSMDTFEGSEEEIHGIHMAMGTLDSLHKGFDYTSLFLA